MTERPEAPEATSDPRPVAVPAATYRLQLHRAFTFEDARALVPYLSALGVTDLLLLTGVPGDAREHARLRRLPPRRNQPGTRRRTGARRAVRRADAARHGPDGRLRAQPHEQRSATNEWWRDVLENGPSSHFARHFDIDWDPVKPELKDRLLLPILGEPYGEALERGALALRFEAGGLVVCYGPLAIPINPRRLPLVVEKDIDRLTAELGVDHPDMRELSERAHRLAQPAGLHRAGRAADRRAPSGEGGRARAARSPGRGRSGPVRAHLTRAVDAFNGVPGDAASFDRLHALLELQAYRLASWRTAADEINYRRFFDINELAGLRVEDDAVFDGHP